MHVAASHANLIPSQFGFGTVHMGRRQGMRGGVRLLETAFERGITHFDTAPPYGLGLSERIVGRFLQGRRDAVTLATKIGESAPPPVSLLLPGRLIRGPLASRRAFDVPRVRTSFERSLRNLGTDHVDVLLLHECSSDEVTDDIQAFLAGCLERGKARSVGTATSVSETAAIRRRWAPFPQLVQVPLDPRAALAGDPLGLDAEVTITHSTVARMLQHAQRELQPSPDRMRSWSETLGVDCANASVWAGLALAAARRANPDGVVLFSSRQAERVTTNLELADRFGAEPQLLARLSELMLTSPGPEGTPPG